MYLRWLECERKIIMAFANRGDPDQTVHPHSLIRVLSVNTVKPVLKATCI